MNQFIAIGPYCWGRGKTTADAVTAMKRSLPQMVKRDYRYALYDIPDPDTEVTELGGMRYKKGLAPKLIEQRHIKNGKQVTP